MFSSKKASQQKRHAAAFEDAYTTQPTADALGCSTTGHFKHPGRCVKSSLPQDQLPNRRSSPVAQSESDKSSPPELFSPASSATSSATSVSSDSSSGIVSPTPSVASWAGSSVCTTALDPSLQPSYPHTYQSINNGPQLKPNPRRTAVSSSWTRPALVRQEQRRQHLVEQLLDSATQLVSQIWPMANTASCFPNKVISLKFYIRETLRRSRTSYSTLQVTLWYLVLIRPFVAAAMRPKHDKYEFDDEKIPEQRPNVEGPSCPLQCGRRMFLSALILASKYLQDRNFTARAWSKITGLPSKEIVSNESMFLTKISWNLHMKEQDFKHWNAIILSCTGPSRLGQNAEDAWSQVLHWIRFGFSLEMIVKRLSVQRQAVCSNSGFGAYNQMSTLLTPNSSFTSSPANSLIPDSALPPSMGVKTSPAISVASDLSASTSYSFTEVKATADKYASPLERNGTGPGCGLRAAGQLLTPSSSFDSTRGQEDGETHTTGLTSIPPSSWNTIGMVDPSYLMDALGNQALVTYSQSNMEVSNGMRAPAQQPLANPSCLLDRSASWPNGPRGGLAQRSIAHSTMKPANAACGHKRSASGMTLAPLYSADDTGTSRCAKSQCSDRLK